MQLKNKAVGGVAAPSTAGSVLNASLITYHSLQANTTVWRDCPNCGYKKSLSVTVKDGRTLFFCHAGCSQDDLWRAVRGGQPIARQQRPMTCRRDDQESLHYIKKLWDGSYPAQGTLVDVYLRGRGLIGSIPVSIRFLPNHPHNPTKTHWPVMLACVTDAAGNLQAIHRTYLARDGRGKANLEPAKMTFGAVGGFAVHLAPAGDKLAVSEGIETGLSVQQATDIPTWAAISAGGMRELILPPLPAAAEVIICADNDQNGCGQRAAHNAAQRWIADGRRVRIALPPTPDSDFNDLLREAVNGFDRT